VSISSEVFDRRVETMPGERQFDAVTLRAVEKMESAISVAIRHTRRYLVLFTTERSQQFLSGFAWREPISLPDAEQRILLIGERI
jgi:16S rRNA G527 N7-methylase RsmG